MYEKTAAKSTNRQGHKDADTHAVAAATPSSAPHDYNTTCVPTPAEMLRVSPSRLTSLRRMGKAT